MQAGAPHFSKCLSYALTVDQLQYKPTQTCKKVLMIVMFISKSNFSNVHTVNQENNIGKPSFKVKKLIKKFKKPLLIK